MKNFCQKVYFGENILFYQNIIIIFLIYKNCFNENFSYIMEKSHLHEKLRFYE